MSKMKKTRRFDKQGTVRRRIVESHKLTETLRGEELRFKKNVPMGEVNLPASDGATARKVRRIVEKRVCQKFWQDNRGREVNGDNWEKAIMKKEISKQIKTVCGGAAEYRFCV